MSRPMCGKCGLEMTPQNARIHPEFFLHDSCLPEELSIGKAETLSAITGVPVEELVKGPHFDEPEEDAPTLPKRKGESLYAYQRRYEEWKRDLKKCARKACKNNAHPQLVHVESGLKYCPQCARKINEGGTVFIPFPPRPAMTLQEAFEMLDNLKVGDFSVHEEVDNFDGRRHCFVVYFAALLESPRAHFYGSTLKDTMDQALAAYKLRCQKQEVAV